MPPLSSTPAVAAITLTAIQPNAVTVITPAVASISLSASPLDVTLYSDLGRESIAVDQPPGGSNYPLVPPIDSTISELLGDFYLSYPDTACSFVRPFRIAWLYGFGTNANAPIGGFPSSPPHAYDIQIVDADDVMVFDSTAEGVSLLPTRLWGDRLKIVEWQSATQVCRAVYFVSWNNNDTPVVYDRFIAPAAPGCEDAPPPCPSAILDERCCEQLPLRVFALQYGMETLRGPVQLVNGFNTTVDVTASGGTDGGSYGATLTFGAAPGSGRGLYPGCSGDSIGVVKINNQAPDTAQNFLLDASECYRIQQPTTLNNATPPVATFSAATLQISNNCGACCECGDFVAVYAAIQNVWDQYHTIYTNTVAAIAAFRAVITAYTAKRAATCVANGEGFRVGLAAVAGGIVSIQIKYCNVGDVAVTGGTMTIAITDGHSGNTGKIGYIDGETFVTGDGDTALTQGFGNAVLGGSYPNYSHVFGKIAPGANATLSFQLYYPVQFFPTPFSVTVAVTFQGHTVTKTITTQPALGVTH